MKMSESGFTGFNYLLRLTNKSRKNEPRRSEGHEDKRVSKRFCVSPISVFFHPVNPVILGILILTFS